MPGSFLRKLGSETGSYLWFSQQKNMASAVSPLCSSAAVQEAAWHWAAGHTIEQRPEGTLQDLMGFNGI